MKSGNSSGAKLKIRHLGSGGEGTSTAWTTGLEKSLNQPSLQTAFNSKHAAK